MNKGVCNAVAAGLIVCECIVAAEVKTVRTVTDMAGRQVTIPAVITSVYSTSPMGEMLMYTLAPEMITGTTWNLDSAARRFLLPVYNEKPLLGGWFGKNTTGNPEGIVNAHPDIVLSMGEMDNTALSAAGRMEEMLGTPVLVLDGRLDGIERTYRFMGSVLGSVARRADSLADYCRATFDTVAAAVARVPPAGRVRFYYAEGLDGLQTDPEGSPHAETLRFAGGINVAVVPRAGGYGRAPVSIEQVFSWNPQVVLVCPDRGYPDGDGNYGRLLDDRRWKMVPAVAAGRVYQVPSLPFNWIDRPPSVNRIIGVRWVAQLLYPDYARFDMNEETRRFYRLFYRHELTDGECAAVLDHALPPPRQSGHTGKNGGAMENDNRERGNHVVP